MVRWCGVIVATWCQLTANQFIMTVQASHPSLPPSLPPTITTTTAFKMLGIDVCRVKPLLKVTGSIFNVKPQTRKHFTVFSLMFSSVQHCRF